MVILWKTFESYRILRQVAGFVIRFLRVASVTLVLVKRVGWHCAECGATKTLAVPWATRREQQGFRLIWNSR